MKITKRQLRRLIQEATSGKIIYVEKSPYGGASIEDEDGEYLSIGGMVQSLLDAGESDFFHDALGLDELMNAHNKGVQGGMTNWDSDVFEQYYSVDMDKMIDKYAAANAMRVEIVPMQEGSGTMKITKRQLKRIIKEEKASLLKESGRHDPDSGYDELRQDRDDEEYDRKNTSSYTAAMAVDALETKSVRGLSFYRLVSAAMDRAEHEKAASYIMDSLMIDDVFDEDEQQLVDMLRNASRQNISHMKVVPQIMSDWMSRF